MMIYIGCSRLQIRLTWGMLWIKYRGGGGAWLEEAPVSISTCLSSSIYTDTAELWDALFSAWPKSTVGYYSSFSCPLFALTTEAKLSSTNRSKNIGVGRGKGFLKAWKIKGMSGTCLSASDHISEYNVTIFSWRPKKLRVWTLHYHAIILPLRLSIQACSFLVYSIIYSLSLTSN